jgi:hypothetical protein
MLEDTNHAAYEISREAGNAFCALPYLAPEAIGPLVAQLTNQDMFSFGLVSGVLAAIGTNIQPAISAWENQLKNTNRSYRLIAVSSLNRTSSDPDKYIPVLIQELPKISQQDRDFYFDVLVRHKEHASNAVPLLISLLREYPESNNSIRQMYRGQITYALHEIAPDLDLTAPPK